MSNLDNVLTRLVVFGGAVSTGSVGAARGAFDFTSGTNAEVVRTLDVEPNVEAMVESLNTLIDDVRLKANRPLILLVDGLDKLREPDMISLNFLEKKLLSRPNCSVVYTGPLDLYYVPQFGGVRARFFVTPLLHVKLYAHDHPDRSDVQGYEVMQELVHRRLESLDLESEKVVEPVALNRLIEGSGGVMRDFIRLMQSAALQAEIAGRDHIAEEDAERALGELRRQLQVQLTPRYQDVLDVVRKTHERTDDQEFALLLQNGLILSYLNGDLWFNTHPLLWR